MTGGAKTAEEAYFDRIQAALLEQLEEAEQEIQVAAEEVKRASKHAEANPGPATNLGIEEANERLASALGRAEGVKKAIQHIQPQPQEEQPEQQKLSEEISRKLEEMTATEANTYGQLRALLDQKKEQLEATEERHNKRRKHQRRRNKRRKKTRRTTNGN